MNTESVSATALARKLALILDQVRYTGKPIHITKGKVIVADIVPPKPAGLPIEELANLIATAPSIGNADKNFGTDINIIRQNSNNKLKNSWD